MVLVINRKRQKLKTSFFGFRVTEEEREALRVAARRRHISEGALVRELIGFQELENEKDTIAGVSAK